MTGRILEIPQYFDVILSDFGRAAAINYTSRFSLLEQEAIQHELAQTGLPFFDEYRRTMFSLVGDVEFIKRTQINSAKRTGAIGKDILIGLDGSTIPVDLAVRIEELLLSEVVLALNRGHRNIRVVIPCNTLSPLSVALHEALAEGADYIIDRARIVPSSARFPEYLRDSKIRVCTVVDSVLSVLSSSSSERDLLVLGTAGTVEIYAAEIQKAASHSGLSVVRLSEGHQDLVHQVLAASLEREPGSMGEMRRTLEREVIEPNLSKEKETLVVEACTDFRLGLGLSSLDIFAQLMVDEVYGADTEAL